MDNFLHVPGLESSPYSCEVSSIVCCQENHSDILCYVWCWCHYW